MIRTVFGVPKLDGRTLPGVSRSRLVEHLMGNPCPELSGLGYVYPVEELQGSCIEEAKAVQMAQMCVSMVKIEGSSAISEASHNEEMKRLLCGLEAVEPEKKGKKKVLNKRAAKSSCSSSASASIQSAQIEPADESETSRMLDTLLSRINSLTSHVEEQRVITNGQIEGLTADNAVLKGQLAAANGQIEGLATHNGALNGRIEVLAADNAALNGRIEVLAADNAALNGRIEGLTADNAALNGRIEGLIVQVEELSVNVQSLRFENAGLDAENSNLAFHVIESRSEIRESIMQARSAEAERFRLDAEMDIRVFNLELALLNSLERVRELEDNFA